MKIRTLALAGVLLASGGVANAAVTYTFVGTGFGLEPVGGSFSFTAADFIRTDRLIESSALNSCSIVVPSGRTCAFVKFLQISPIDNSANDTIEFQPFDIVAPRFAFSDGAFTAFGTYASITTGGGGIATLTVADTANAVPEPATWALMAGGFGLAGATLRRRRPAPARA